MKKQSVIDRYIDTFDDCRPLEFMGLTVRPFTVRQIRQCYMSCYCLSVDPVEFEDVSLLTVKRLPMIFQIWEQYQKGLIGRGDTVRREVLRSFKCLCNTLFSDYRAEFPGNARRVISFRGAEDGSAVELGVKEFEDLSELILYQNGIDVSYLKKYPPNTRRELRRMAEIMNRRKKTPSIEKLIDSAFLLIGSYDAVMRLPVRKFYNLLQNTQQKESFEILTSGMYSTKNVAHWMSGGYASDPFAGLMSTERETRDKFKDL